MLQRAKATALTPCVVRMTRGAGITAPIPQSCGPIRPMIGATRAKPGHAPECGQNVCRDARADQCAETPEDDTMRDDAFSHELDDFSSDRGSAEGAAAFMATQSWSAEDEAFEAHAEAIELRAFEDAQPTYSDEDIPGWGVVTVVGNFISGVDQIVLEFDPSDGPLPLLTFDHTLEDGSTALMGDGRLMAIVRGVTEVRRADVNMLVAEDVSVAECEVGETDKTMPMLENFDPAEDVIEIMYNPTAHPDPKITVEDFADGTGADILLDGKSVLRIAGAQGIDPAEVRLVEQVD